MIKQRGITLVSLVVTIIILIILATISINAVLGENGIITIAKQAKENIELAQIEEQTKLNELYTQMETELGESGGISYDAIAKLAEFKRAIADYIEEAGGVKPDYASEEIAFGESIKGILKEVTKDATATAQDITQGKTAYVNGELIEGEGYNVSQDELQATLLWTNPNPTFTFSATTLDIDLTEYKNILIITKTSTDVDVAYRSAIMCKIPSGGNHRISATGTNTMRSLFVENSKISISSEIGGNNSHCIPLYIFGLKSDFGIDSYITQSES